MELSRDKIKEIINDDWLLMDDCEGNKNCDVVKELARISLASLELEHGMIRHFDLDMSNCDSCGKDCGADMVEDLDGEYVLWHEVLPYLYRYDEYTATTATVYVPDAATEIRACIDEFPESVRDIVEECASIAENACRAAMLQGADGNSPAIPDAYDIEAFGVFSATEGENGLMLQIERFRFGTGKCPQIGKENMVPKFALQAIINRLQEHCDSMGNEALVDILSTPAAPQQEVK